jgi:hypothetical protein
VDVFGDPDSTCDNNCPWNYRDGWAYRKEGEGPSATFDVNDWTLSGRNALDDASCTTNASCSSQFPIGTYSDP